MKSEEAPGQTDSSAAALALPVVPPPEPAASVSLALPALERTPLPNLRSGLTAPFVIFVLTGKDPTNMLATERMDIVVTTGEYANGRLGEVFAKMGTLTGTKSRGLMNAVCQALSLLLQRGMPLEELYHKYRHEKYPPMGPVEGPDGIRACSSPLDLVFQWLEIHYDLTTNIRRPSPLRPAHVAVPAATIADFTEMR